MARALSIHRYNSPVTSSSHWALGLSHLISRRGGPIVSAKSGPHIRQRASFFINLHNTNLNMEVEPTHALIRVITRVVKDLELGLLNSINMQPLQTRIRQISETKYPVSCL
ncbi:hypothetical protein M8J75_007858 [Diaphorina citri]|nr:hypothetical protein M8J75_007858 [Diaphorina citri]